MPSLSRRQLLGAAGLLALGPTGRRLLAADPPALPPLNRFPRMVQEYFVEQVRSAEQAGNAARAALKTKADAEAYVRDVRKKIADCFGPFPKKTPLNPRVTGKVERDAYTIEKVIFESRPDFLVTANLYVPKGKPFPLPGVVGSCGHSANGKAAEAYQSFAQGLARMGYVVLIFDPIGQGERLQYGHVEKEHRPGVGVGEHLLGRQPAVPGRRVLRHLAGLGRHPRPGLPAHPQGGRSAAGRRHRQLRRRHDDDLAVRRRAALDDGRPELLRHHLPPQPGERAARRTPSSVRRRPWPSTSTTPTSWPALAPKPVVILAKEKDYFDVRGARGGLRATAEALQAARRGGERRPVHRPDRPRVLAGEPRGDVPVVQPATRVSDAKAEPKLTIEKDETLWCTPERPGGGR